MSDLKPNGEQIFLCTEGESRKFWRVRVEGSVQRVRYGRIDTQGQVLTKAFESSLAASKATEKLIAEKRGKGYRLVSEAELHVAAKACTSAPARRRKKPNSPYQQLQLPF